jgi:signal transduction histidine kinase
MGDGGRVRQVITNLLTNAIKVGVLRMFVNVDIDGHVQFTSEGSISLSAFEESVSEEVVQVKVVIQDTGCGIPAPHLGRLFRPFSQADSSTARRFGMMPITVPSRFVLIPHRRDRSRFDN